MIPKTRWAKTIDDAYIAYQDFGDCPVTVEAIDGSTSLEVLWENSVRPVRAATCARDAHPSDREARDGHVGSFLTTPELGDSD